MNVAFEQTKKKLVLGCIKEMVNRQIQEEHFRGETPLQIADWLMDKILKEAVKCDKTNRYKWQCHRYYTWEIFF